MMYLVAALSDFFYFAQMFIEKLFGFMKGEKE